MPAGLTNIQTHTQTYHFMYTHTGGTITAVKEETRDRIQYTSTISHFNLIINLIICTVAVEKSPQLAILESWYQQTKCHALKVWHVTASC